MIAYYALIVSTIFFFFGKLTWFLVFGCNPKNELENIFKSLARMENY